MALPRDRPAAPLMRTCAVRWSRMFQNLLLHALCPLPERPLPTRVLPGPAPAGWYVLTKKKAKTREAATAAIEEGVAGLCCLLATAFTLSAPNMACTYMLWQNKQCAVCVLKTHSQDSLPGLNGVGKHDTWDIGLWRCGNQRANT